MDEVTVRLVPKPSKAEGWYEAAGGGRTAGFTSNPAFAKMVPVCSLCDEYHPEPEGSCLL